MNPPAKVCVLSGANGYVGRILRRALEFQGWRVVGLSRNGAEDTIPWSLEGGSRPAPTAAREVREEFLKNGGVSVLVHAAWDLSLTRPKDLERVNVQGSLHLFAETVAAGVPRIVFVSTISAYQGARSDYGRTKLAVERAAQRYGGIVLRPGLVYGPQPGGMFGALRKQTGASSMIPLIGDGSYPQYLVHQDDLAAAVVRAVSIEEAPDVPITVAHPHPWSFRALIEEIARSQGKSPRLVPVPWPLVYGGLKLAETLGCPLRFRSDSVLSLVRQNPHPEWNAALLGVKPRPFTAAME